MNISLTPEVKETIYLQYGLCYDQATIIVTQQKKLSIMLCACITHAFGHQ